jgi:hypothetical protein
MPTSLKKHSTMSLQSYFKSKRANLPLAIDWAFLLKFLYLLYLVLNIILFDCIHEKNHMYHLFQIVAVEVTKTVIDRISGVESNESEDSDDEANDESEYSNSESEYFDGEMKVASRNSDNKAETEQENETEDKRPKTVYFDRGKHHTSSQYITLHHSTSHKRIGIR